LSHGFADRIFCNDCKKSYDCENCGHPYSILNEEDGRFLYCKSCKNKKILKEDQYVICKHCGSWRVFPFGIGGQKVLDFLKRELPLPGGGINPPAWQGEFLLIDESEKKLSAKKIKESVKNFLNGDTNILIGSLRTLKVLKTILKLPRHTATPSKEGELVDKTIVVSTGPLVRGKYFDSDEKLLKLISELESISKELYVNKHEGDEVSLENYKDKNKFIEEEIEFRKTTNLPPFYKVLTLIFSYKEKRIVDKFLSADLEKFKISGEIKKGNKFIYYWFISNDFELIKFVEILRQFGDVFLANSIIEQSIMKK
jgi:primosomal protein N'